MTHPGVTDNEPLRASRAGEPTDVDAAGAEWERVTRATLAIHVDWTKRERQAIEDFILTVRHSISEISARLTDSRAATSAEPVAWGIRLAGKRRFFRLFDREGEARESLTNLRSMESPDFGPFEFVAFYASPAPQVAALSGCPCTLAEPCSEQCSCAHPSQSGGCQRCALYGSQDQRVATATRLAALSAALEACKAQLRAQIGANVLMVRDVAELHSINEKKV